MRKFLASMLLMAFMLPFTMQADEITIGTGTSTTYTAPFNNFYRNSWNETIYPESSINMACVINSIAYDCATSASVLCSTLKVYMGVTTRTEIASTSDWTPEGDLTLVYSGTNVTIGATTGWNTITLDSPYTYEGSDNLVIVVSKTTASYSSSLTWRYTSTTNTCMYSQNDTDPTYANYPTRTGTRGAYRANVKLNVTPIVLSCYRPTAMQVVSTSATSATIGWTPYPGTAAFDVYITSDGIAPNEATTPTASNVTGTSYTFTGLTGGTVYSAYVRGNCGSGDYSSWRGTNFVTEPDFSGSGTEDNPYLLYSSADMDALGNVAAMGWATKGKFFKVMRDIDGVTNPVGSAAYPFQGDFNGNGFTINVDINGMGLFAAGGPGLNIHDLTVDGTVTNGAARTGGIVGQILIATGETQTEDMYIVNCTNKATINSTSGGNVGGIVGYYYGLSTYADTNPTLSIIGCTNRGSVSGTGTYVGGIVGYELYDCVIDDCLNRGDVTNTSTYTGGIVGRHACRSTVTNCGNTGTITSGNYAGGVVAYNYAANVENCYNTGAVDGGTYTGGVVGYNYGTSTYAGYGYTENVYNGGSVTASNTTNCGAVVGYNSNAYSYMNGAYYKSGSYSVAYGSNSTTSTISYVVSFTQAEEDATVCTLASAGIGGSTDLRTALNNWRNGNADYNEWLTDIYGNNFYFPTFVVGNPPGLEITPNPLAMGPRPIGANVHGEAFTLNNTGLVPISISMVDFANSNFFIVDENSDVPEFPIVIDAEESEVIYVTTDPEATVAAGTVSGSFLALWSNRSVGMADITATAYVPVVPDVVETPAVVSSYPYTATQSTATIYDNYYLPGDKVDGPDGVYKMTFTNDMKFNAEITEGNNAKLALYADDFGGMPYPDMENYYTGPVINSGIGGDIPTISEGFESGDFLAYNWVNDPTYPWVIATDDVYEGSYSAKSNNAGVSSSEAGITLNFDVIIDGMISFYWKASSEGSSFDIPKFYIDGVLQTPTSGWASGGFDWTLCEYEVTAGEHTFTWAYKKDSSVNSGQDCIWVDNITIAPVLDLGRQTMDPVLNGGDGPIENMTVVAGTYYLVASSTSAQYVLNIDPQAIPMPVAAGLVSPADGATEVVAPVILRWILGQYTTEYQVLIGTTYPPTDVLVDWSDDLLQRYIVSDLLNNSTYFWRVNERNSSGVTEGPVWGFTTSLNVPQNLFAADYNLYEGENADLRWTAVNDRSHRGYNIYQDGVKINEAPVTATEYSVAGLSYNMNGYRFNVTAVYDEGESAYSNTALVRVSGNGLVSGIVYEQDALTPVEGATVTVSGIDEYNVAQSFTGITNADGTYDVAVLAGIYGAEASKSGYQTTTYVNAEGEMEFEVVYAMETPDISFNMKETYVPVGEVIAEEIDDNMVKVYWSWDVMSTLIEDFETGDFTANEWDNTVTPGYEWEISTNNPYEGTYCMKSTCEGVDYGSSAIQITVEVPYNGLMSFYQLISSEQNYDKGHFYIDGVEKTTASGTSAWTYKEFNVSEGEHTYKWEYTKDVSLGSGSDCYAIDYITFYQQPEPWPGEGWIFYDDGVNVDAIGLTAGGSFYWGIMFPAATLAQYGSFSLTKVGCFDYAAHTGNILIYEGGDAAPETLIHSQPYTATGSSAYVEYTLTSALSINNSQNLWIVMNNNDGTHVAACGANTGDPNGRWISLDGTTWEDIVDSGLEYTWNLRGFITNARGNVMALANDNVKGQIAYEGKGTPGGIFTTDPNATTTNFGAGMRGYDRSFNSYRVYRTDCYNEDYTVENTQLLAGSVTDTVYMDMSWANAEPGVYKWGVSAYYAGNRGSNNRSINISANSEQTPEAPVETTMTNRAMWDLVNSFYLSSAGQQGIATDGNFIYTCSWQASPTGGYPFYKYDMDGNFIEGFSISGVSAIRDLAYDGTYFYGGAGGSVLYTFDLANHTLIGSTSTSCSAIRHCTYDPENDGFWVGNWTDLKLINRSGATVTTAPAPNSAYGSGYFKDSNNESHLLLFCQPNSDAKVYDYNITTGVMGSSPIFDFAVTPGFISGSSISGGAFVGVYNGMNCFFGNMQQDPNLVAIYELSVATPPVPPVGLQEPGESPIVWSNCLDKDMITTLDVTVSTNSGDTPAGTSVSFVNVSEPDLAIAYEVELDETGMYAWSEVRKGTYLYTISLDGYTACAVNDSIEIWDPTSVECVLEEIIHTAGNLYVSPTGWAMWDGTGAGGTGGGTGDEFTVDFEGGLPADWAMIDADGDGNNWTYDDGTMGGTAHGGTGYMTSASYDNSTGVLYPDNYIVSAQVAIGGSSSLSFYVSAQDAAYAGEHYGVAISTGSNTNANDFTTIWEETLTAKGGAPYAGPRGTRAQGNWYQKTVDLSEYAGQQVYIAIRHFNVSDMFRINLDDVALTAGRDTDAFQYYKVMLDGVFAIDTQNNYYQHDVTNLVEGEEYTTRVAAMYTTGMSAWSEYTWTYVPCENYEGVTNYTAENVNNEAVLTWTMPNGGPTPPPGPGDEFFYDFEDGTMGEWTMIDADGDGYNWILGQAPGTSGNNGSNYTMYSQSYSSVALHPDNYFVSKQVTVASGAKFSFYACAQDASYPAEHYGVAISTTGNTNAADFTTIWEETMTAKNFTRDDDGIRGNRVQGNWYYKEIDLSAYAGQQVYIAVRHFNCTDMFYLDVDDIALTAGRATRDILFDQSEMVTNPGAGAGGKDVSALQGSQSTFGPNVNQALGYYLADDFTLASASTIQEIEVFAYQTGSGNNSTLTGLYLRIYDGNPMSGGQVIWGDANNVLSETSWTNIYRTTGDDLSNTQRPIMSAKATGLDIQLEAGQYWLEWTTTGSSSSGPWGAPRALPGELNTGDGLQNTGSAWTTLLDSGSNTPYGMAMTISGTGGSTPPQPVGGIVGAMVFRDGELLTPMPIDATTYTDAAPVAPSHEYCVRVVYGDEQYGEDWYAMSCPECAIVDFDLSCPAPEDLFGRYTWNDGGTYGATLIWPYDGSGSPIEEWLYYDNGTNTGSIGAGGTLYWGISFNASDLAAYSGCSLTEVALYDAYAGTYTMNIYYGGTSAPATLVHSQDISLTGAGDWNYATLTTALPLDVTQPLWITFYNSGVTYPAAGCDYTGNMNSCWVSVDGSEWMDIMSASGGSMSYTWMIRGFVTNQAKGGEIVALDSFKGDTGSNLSAIVVEPMETSFAANRDIDHFNIYRSTTNGNYTLIGEAPANAGTYFDDRTGEPDEYYYQVTAVYTDGCESAPANSYLDPEDDYVMVDVTSVEENGIENARIYPNPTNDKLNIEVADMTRITVTTVLGQVMYDQEVSSSSEIIDMSQYGAGVYMVRIVTNNGSMIKRIMVNE